MAASFIPFLSPEALMPSTLPSKEDMEEVLLRLRKEALVQEFFWSGGHDRGVRWGGSSFPFVCCILLLTRRSRVPWEISLVFHSLYW